MLILHMILALLVIVFWSLTFAVIKVGLEGISPLLLVFGRFFLTSLPILFIQKPQTPWKIIVWYGLIMFALQFSLLFMGMYAGVSPGLAALLAQMHVFVTATLAAVFLQEKMKPWQIVGALVAFSGIVLVAMNVGGNLTWPGFLMVLGGAVCFGTGNVISKRFGKVNMIALVAWASLVAWPPLLILTLVVDGPASIWESLTHLTWMSGGAVLYLAYLSTLFCFGAWSFLLHHHPTNTIVPLTLLVPVLALFSSVLLFGEPLQSWKIVAAVLVILGLGINILGPKLKKLFS